MVVRRSYLIVSKKIFKTLVIETKTSHSLEPLSLSLDVMVVKVVPLTFSFIYLIIYTCQSNKKDERRKKYTLDPRRVSSPVLRRWTCRGDVMSLVVTWRHARWLVLVMTPRWFDFVVEMVLDVFLVYLN
jgi:hypothetical protein